MDDKATNRYNLMASVKRIEGSTIHKIQSGQVIVDLCSAVKELVENAIDAESTSIGEECDDFKRPRIM